jgi:uncharacterized protein (TIGR01777 family)
MSDVNIVHGPWAEVPAAHPVPPARAALLTASSSLPASPAELFAWHSREGAFERLSPPWQRVEVLDKQGGIESGATLLMRMKVGPIGVRWLARHGPACPPHVFSDVQEKGPFSYWSHLHRFADAAEGGALIDEVAWRPPLGRLGHLLTGWKFRRDFERLFRYRHRVTAHDLARHANGGVPMHIAISGASGLIGTALTAFLTTGGHTVSKLVRREARGPREIRWDPDAGTVDTAALEGVDAVIHLAGENVGGGRWTEARKTAILESRVRGTRALAEAIGRLEKKPAVFISASATGIYGDAHVGPDAPTAAESSPLGSGFLADVCRAWEAAADPARAAGIRVVHPRIGIVLDPRGGALEKLLTPFRMGAGGRVGSGRQWMSWIALEDVLGALHHIVLHPELRGPVNVVAPHPVTNADFTRTLGHVLGRPTIAPVPALAVRALFGEMGDALLLASQRVYPRRLLESGFEFAFPDLEGALRHTLGRRRRDG